MTRWLLFVLTSLSVSVAVAVEVTAGEEVTLTASPAAGQAFHHWSGTPAPTGEAAFQSSWTYTPTKSGTVTPVYGTLVEVTSGADLAAAITSAGQYGVVRAAAGEYSLTDQLTIGTVRLEGAGRTGASVSTIRQTSGNVRCLYLNNACAYVSGFVITGATGGSVPNGPGAYIDSNGGTIVDCRLTGNASSSAHIYGGGVYCKSSAGLVARCVIDGNNLAYGSLKSNGHGGGVFLSAGALENCLIYGNISSHDAGGVYVEGGTVRNCTIVDNFCQGLGGLSMKNSVNVYNCAIYDNVGWFGSSDSGNEWYCMTASSSNSLKNCSSSLPIGQTGLVAQPDFVDAVKRDYSLVAGSALVDAGGDAGTFASLPLDLNRNPRSSGAALDIGCCEYQQPQPALGLRAEPREALVGANVRFVPVLRGGLEASTYAWTVKDASGATVKTFSGEEPDPMSFDTPGA